MEIAELQKMRTDTLVSYPSSVYLVVINQNRKCFDTVLPSVDNLTVDRSPRSEDVSLALRRNEFFTHRHPSFHGN